MCEHSPLSFDDCKPHKALRTTIKVFLRTEEKKRETSRPKEAKESEPPTPVDAAAASKPDELKSPVAPEQSNEAAQDAPTATGGNIEAAPNQDASTVRVPFPWWSVGWFC